jgi:hypothetical protein
VLFFACIDGGMWRNDFVGGVRAIAAHEFDSNIGGLDAGAVLVEKIAERNGARDLEFRSVILVRALDPLF